MAPFAEFDGLLTLLALVWNFYQYFYRNEEHNMIKYKSIFKLCLLCHLVFFFISASLPFTKIHFLFSNVSTGCRRVDCYWHNGNGLPLWVACIKFGLIKELRVSQERSRSDCALLSPRSSNSRNKTENRADPLRCEKCCCTGQKKNCNYLKYMSLNP